MVQINYPINNTAKTGVYGYDMIKVSDLSNETLTLMKQNNVK